MKKNNKIVAGIIISLSVFIFFALLLRGKNVSTDNDISEVTIRRGDETVRVGRDGKVNYFSSDNEYSEIWDEEKIKAYFGYFDKKYLLLDGQLVRAGNNTITIIVNGKEVTYVLSDDEEIDDQVIDDAQNPDDGDNGGGGVDNYFTSSPTATPTSAAGGTSRPTPTPPPWVDPECLYWRLSYCVRKRTPTPSPTPVATAEIRPDNCEDNLQTGKTVISNELCVPTPTPYN